MKLSSLLCKCEQTLLDAETAYTDNDIDEAKLILKLITVVEAAKDYVEGRSVNIGTLELEDAIDELEKE